MYFGTDKGDRLTKVTEYSFLINASFSEVDYVSNVLIIVCGVKKKKVENHLFVGQRTNDKLLRKANNFFKKSALRRNVFPSVFCSKIRRLQTCNPCLPIVNYFVNKAQFFVLHNFYYLRPKEGQVWTKKSW